MTAAELKRLFPNASQSTINANRDSADLGAMGAGQRESSAQPALVKDTPAKHCRPSRVEVVVSIIVCQRRLFDDDNSVSGGTKALRDAIADSLGVKDHDKRIRWCYGQLHCKGPEGVIVMIQRL